MSAAVIATPAKAGETIYPFERVDCHVAFGSSQTISGRRDGHGESMIIARHLVVTGRVQGVFFRGWTAEQARAL
ncbi:MAG: acylphosphatase, partial [Sphingomicrobium sp.]